MPPSANYTVQPPAGHGLWLWLRVSHANPNCCLPHMLSITLRKEIRKECHKPEPASRHCSVCALGNVPMHWGMCGCIGNCAIASKVRFFRCLSAHHFSYISKTCRTASAHRACRLFQLNNQKRIPTLPCYPQIDTIRSIIPCVALEACCRGYAATLTFISAMT